MRNKKTKTGLQWVFIAGCVIVAVIGILAIRTEMTDKEAEEKTAMHIRDSVLLSKKAEKKTAIQNPDTMPRSPKVEENVDVSAVLKKLAHSKLRKYYNDRFGFTFFYPSCFKMGPAPTNNDGRAFKMGPGFVLVASGMHIGEEETFSKRYEFSRSQLSPIIYSHKKGNCYVLAGKRSKDDAEENAQENYSATASVGYWQKSMLMKSSLEGVPVWFDISLYYPSEYSKAADKLIKMIDKNNPMH